MKMPKMFPAVLLLLAALLAGCGADDPTAAPLVPTATEMPVTAPATATPEGDLAVAGGYGIAWSGDGSRLALGGMQGQVYLFSMPDGARLQTWQLPTEAFSVAFAPDGASVAAGGVGIVTVWDAASGAERFSLAAPGLVFGLAYSPDGSMLVSAGEALESWNAADGSRVAVLGVELQGVSSVAFAVDGARMASGDRAQMIIWNTADWSKVFVREGHGMFGYGLAFSPDGAQLAEGHFTAQSTSGSNDQVWMWDMADGEKLGYLEGCGGNNVAFSPDGLLLASACLDGDVTIWRFPDGSSLGKMQTEAGLAVHSLAFSPDGTLLALGLENGAVEMWRVSDLGE